VIKKKRTRRKRRQAQKSEREIGPDVEEVKKTKETTIRI
jgi:hypothetical protein